MTLKRLQSAGPPVAAAATSKKIKILYVEDEDVNWEVTLLNLYERYDIERAKNAKEAFDHLRHKSFHVILMDIQLSGSDMDGTEITRALRGTLTKVPAYAEGFRLPDIPIIFMTAYSARYTLADLQAVGGDELVRKPVDFAHLSACLSRCLLKSVRPKGTP